MDIKDLALPMRGLTRDEFVSAVAAGNAPTSGFVWAGGLEYRYSSGATAISDLPGWLPRGDWVPEHFADVTTDVTSALTAMLAAANTLSQRRVCLWPSKNYTVSAEIVIPHGVREIDMQGAKITRTTDNFVFTRRGSVASPSADQSITGRFKGDRLISVSDVNAFSVGDWVLLRAGNLLPTYTAGSRVSCIRRVATITGALNLDAALNRDMNETLSIRRLALAPSIEIKNGTIESQSQAEKKALIFFFFCIDANVTNCRIGNSGGAGIAYNYTVGGIVSGVDIYDLLDDLVNGHAGYGVVAQGAVRGLCWPTGTARRVRHAFTTTTCNQGLVPSENAALVDLRGEPEACVIGPNVYAYDTTNAAFDLHPEGYGIIIYPNAHGCLTGVNVRATNATIMGGQLIACRREGVRITLGPVNQPATVPLKVRVVGTTIDVVALDGTGGTESVGIVNKCPGGEIEIANVVISGAKVGIRADNTSKLIANNVLIDGNGVSDVTGVSIDGQNCTLRNVLVRNANIGFQEGEMGSGNRLLNFETDNVTTPLSRTPTYTMGEDVLGLISLPTTEPATANKLWLDTANGRVLKISD